jgi:hypothetical protein
MEASDGKATQNSVGVEGYTDQRKMGSGLRPSARSVL